MTRYPLDRYGAWGGSPDGNAFDPKRCAYEVCARERWARFYQCQRRPGHGDRGLFVGNTPNSIPSQTNGVTMKGISLLVEQTFEYAKTIEELRALLAEVAEEYEQYVFNEETQDFDIPLHDPDLLLRIKSAVSGRLNEDQD